MVSQQRLGFPPKLGEGYWKAVGGSEKGTYQSGARCFLEGLMATRTAPLQASPITRAWADSQLECPSPGLWAVRGHSCTPSAYV